MKRLTDNYSTKEITRHGRSGASYDLIFGQPARPVTQPQSQVEQMMSRMEAIFLDHGLPIRIGSIQYHEKHVATCFSCIGTGNLFSDGATAAIQMIQSEIALEINKRVVIAVERLGGTVWVYR
jgi:hypothetical protein